MHARIMSMRGKCVCAGALACVSRAFLSLRLSAALSLSLFLSLSFSLSLSPINMFSTVLFASTTTQKVHQRYRRYTWQTNGGT